MEGSSSSWNLWHLQQHFLISTGVSVQLLWKKGLVSSLRINWELLFRLSLPSSCRSGVFAGDS
jgi:hypothetical protein